MSRLPQALQRVVGAAAPGTLRPRSIDTNFSIIKEGDRAILHGKQSSMTKVLKSGGTIHTHKGALLHDHIIGKRVWETVQSQKGQSFRVSLPTLEEYVSLTPRLVTPIYPQDASLITSLLDIHVDTPAADETQPPLEILESGTGHGSLTLHLARAIHAANTTPPPLPHHSQIKYLKGRTLRPNETVEQIEKDEPISSPEQEEWDAWRAQRKAIVHTVDVGAKYSALAEKNVRGFRRGVYAGNTDFYVGPVEMWVAQQKELRRKTGLASLTGDTVEPFLSHVILDMPSANLRISDVTPILKRDGLLVVFVPSITQIGECLQLIKDQGLPLVQEKVIELGHSISGGRAWDLRFATKKSGSDPSTWAASSNSKSTTSESEGMTSESEGMTSESEDTTSESEDMTSEPEAEEQASDTDSAEIIPERMTKEESVLVCRPKVGLRTQGGGFVGVWRRIEKSSRSASV